MTRLIYADRVCRDARIGIVVDFSGLLRNGDGSGVDRIKAARAVIPEDATYIPVFSPGLVKIVNRSIQLYDYVSAVFDPRVTTDLQYPDTVNFIGKRLYWQASWVIEDGPYAGQFAMCVQVTSDDERTPFCWVPECDLVDVRHEDGRQVHAKVMAYLQQGKDVDWTGADEIIEGRGIQS